MSHVDTNYCFLSHSCLPTHTHRHHQLSIRNIATAIGRIRCVTCHKEKVTYKCRGCSLEFCFSHLKDHHQELGQQLHEIEVTRNLFRQSLTEQTKEPQKQSLIQQINEWERESIDKIRHTAEEARQQ